MKQKIKNLFKKNKLISKYYRNGYFAVDLKILLMNFLFQRVFRINSESKFSVHYTSSIIRPDKISYGDFSLKSFIVSPGLYIQAGNGITLGKNVLIGPGCKLISANHSQYDMEKWEDGTGIYIGDNVWMGANVIVLPNVKIANNCIIGAGAVVTKSFLESDCIIAGNPASVIKKR